MNDSSPLVVLYGHAGMWETLFTPNREMRDCGMSWCPNWVLALNTLEVDDPKTLRISPRIEN